MKMKIGLMALILLGIEGMARPDDAGLYYDVTFENPPHVEGQYVTNSGPSDGPTYNGGFLVSNVLLMGSQAAISGDTMSFANSSGFVTSGLHSISWDWALLAPDTNENLQCNVTLWQTDVGIAHMRGGNYDVRYGSTYWSSSYVDNFVYHYDCEIDMDSHTFSFFIDGNPILSDMLVPGTIFDKVSFYRPYGNTIYAVDNFRWEIVVPPEMTSILTAIEVGYATQSDTLRRRD